MDTLTVGFTFPKDTIFTYADFAYGLGLKPDDLLSFLVEENNITVIRHRKTETIRVGDILKYYKPEFEDFGPLK